MKSSYLNRALVVGLIGLAACDSTERTTQPPLAYRSQNAALTRAALVAVDADRQLMRAVAMDAARDGIKNANVWFGDRKHRTRESVCGGMERLIAKHMAKYDQAKLRGRSTVERAAAATEIIDGLGCRAGSPMSMYGKPLALLAPLAARSEAAAPDSIDDWLGANFRESPWTLALQNHVAHDGGPIAPYIEGMTEFESANFAAVACAGEAVIADIGSVIDDTGGGGEDPMMMFFLPAWAKAALGGCAGNVIVNIPDLVTAARLGFFFWGPAGAAAVTAAVAAEHCIYGAVAGFIGYKLAT